MDVLLEVRNLKKYFPVTKGIILQKQIGVIKAVDGVSFNIRRGETLGLGGKAVVERQQLPVVSFNSTDLPLEKLSLRGRIYANFKVKPCVK